MKQKTMAEWFAGQGKYFFGLLLVVFLGMSVSLPVSAQTFPFPPVSPPPLPPFPEAQISLSASPTTIPLGQSATISWSSIDTVSCTASGAWSGPKNLSGTESVSPTETSTYTLNCAGSFLGSTEESVTVTVTPLAPDTTNPTKPTGFVGTVVSSSQINFSWTASTDPIVAGQIHSGVAEYRIERCQSSGCTNFVQIGTSTGTTYSDTGRMASTYYRYRVRAVDGAGNVSSFSSRVGRTTSALARPTGLTASAISNSQIDLAWTESTDVNVTGYAVERCQGSSCSSFSQIETTADNAYSDTGLLTNTVYRYRVRATDDAGHVSSYSSVVSKRTLVE